MSNCPRGLQLPVNAVQQEVNPRIFRRGRESYPRIMPLASHKYAISKGELLVLGNTLADDFVKTNARRDGHVEAGNYALHGKTDKRIATTRNTLI